MDSLCTAASRPHTACPQSPWKRFAFPQPLGQRFALPTGSGAPDDDLHALSARIGLPRAGTLAATVAAMMRSILSCALALAACESDDGHGGGHSHGGGGGVPEHDSIEAACDHFEFGPEVAI